MSEQRQCSRCFYWQEHFDQSKEGECRRHAPQQRDSDGNGRFPRTTHTTWCGEFRDKA